jgi:hypothetical protein
MAVTSLVRAFPTPENLAKLSGYGAELSASFVEKIAEINEEQKRGLVDHLSEPIQGQLCLRRN